MRARRWRVVAAAGGAVALVAAVVLVGAAGPVSALTSYSVTSLVDGAPGSLRDVLDQANADGDDSYITLVADAEHELDICPAAAADDDGNANGDLDSTDATHDLTIVGSGSTIRQTCPNSRVLDSQVDGATTTLRGVTITGGQATTGNNNGGGVLIEGAGALSVTGSTIAGNQADNVGGGISASLDDDDQVFIVDSTISGNTASGGSGGGVFTIGQNLIVNSTISGNTAESSAALVGDTRLIYATIYGNIAAASGLGEGVQIDIGDLTTFASVIAGGVGVGDECVTSFTVSDGWNLSDDDSCGLTDPTDQTSIDPLLGPLADNGSETQTHLPQPGSPLIDAVPVGSCDPTYVADQRNVARPQGPGCDTGSVEVRQEAPPTTTTSTTAAPTTSTTTAARAVVAQPRFTG